LPESDGQTDLSRIIIWWWWFFHRT